MATSWHYFDQNKRQRQAILAYNLIKSQENTNETELIWNISLMIENDLKTVSKCGFNVKYKFSNGWNNKKRIYFFFSK